MVIGARGGLQSLQFCRPQKSWGAWCTLIAPIFAIITPTLPPRRSGWSSLPPHLATPLSSPWTWGRGEVFRCLRRLGGPHHPSESIFAICLTVKAKAIIWIVRRFFNKSDYSLNAWGCELVTGPCENGFPLWLYTWLSMLILLAVVLLLVVISTWL